MPDKNPVQRERYAVAPVTASLAWMLYQAPRAHDRRECTRLIHEQFDAGEQADLLIVDLERTGQIVERIPRVVAEERRGSRGPLCWLFRHIADGLYRSLRWIVPRLLDAFAAWRIRRQRP